MELGQQDCQNRRTEVRRYQVQKDNAEYVG